MDINLDYTIPREGAIDWYDLMYIPADAPHVDNAYLFLDFMLRPDVIARATNFLGYANANRDATPLVDPETTMMPPGFNERIECAQEASPTVSNTASTRSGSRSPFGKVACAPSLAASARFSSVRPVTQTCRPAARPSCTSAVDTPPEAPWTSIVCPGRSPDLTNSMR